LIFKLLLKNYFTTIIFIILILSFIDTAFVTLYLNSYDFRSSIYTSVAFISIISVYCIGYFLILKFIDDYNLTSKKKFEIRILNYIFYGISIIIIVLSLQVLFLQKFSLYLYELIIFINYLLSIIIFLFLIKKILAWYLLTKNFFILNYVLAIVSFIITEILTIIKVIIESSNDPFLISPIRNPWNAFSSNDIVVGNLLYISYFSNIIILWIATASFIKNYSNITGKLKFVLLITLPLIIFVGPLEINIFHFLDELRLENQTLAKNINIFLFGGIRQVAGLFFAISFFILIRNIHNNQLNNALLLAAMGIILFFSANQNSLLKMIPYPPFGIGLTILIPLSSFLLYLGFYNIAITTKHNVIKEIVTSFLSKDQKKFFQDINFYEVNSVVGHVNSKIENMPQEIQHEFKEINIEELTKIVRNIMEEKKFQKN
jgi:hypothetical protein